jgi:acetylornithine deacetylase
MNPKHEMTRRSLLRASGTGVALALSPFAGLAAGRGPGITRDALALAERYRGDLTDLLSSLVSIRSHSGESAAEAQEVVAAYLSRLSYRVESSADVPSRLVDHIEFMPPNPPGDGPFVNIIGHPPEGRAMPVGMFAHIDTEIPGDGWTTDPYEITRVGERLYGLGTADDKGGIAAMLVASAALRESGGPLPLVMSLHGKGGGSRGSLPVFNRLSGPQAVLYVHPAETGRGMADIKNVVQGALDVTLTMNGWRGEPNEINSPESALYKDGGDALAACWGAIEHLRSSVLNKFDVNVGILEGGDRLGAVPETAQAQMRILFNPPATWRQLLADLQSELGAFVKTLPQKPMASGGTSPPGRGMSGDSSSNRSPEGRQTFSGTIERTGLGTNPGAVDWDSPYCLGLREAITGITGRAPTAYENHYAGDIRFPIRLLGVPAFGVGSVGGNFYGPDEWVDEDDLVRLAAVVIDTTRSWASLAG